MKKKSGPEPTKRVRYAEMNRLKYLNLWLTLEESNKLTAIAEKNCARKAEMAYSAILYYLKDRAMIEDRDIVLSPTLIMRDHYWGSPEEVMNPRHKPRGFVVKDEARSSVSQQWLTNEALMHVRAIERYYRVHVDDLAGCAIDHMAKKEGVEASDGKDIRSVFIGPQSAT